MRVAWTEPEPSYNGDLVRFPALRCEPKPVQKPYPPILLGAHGPKAIERVARTYDGWMPLVQNAEAFKCDVATLRKLTASNGRNPAALQITAIVDPREDGLSVEELRAYKEAGASRVMVFSQKLGIAMADGAALDLVKRYAPVVERAHRV